MNYHAVVFDLDGTLADTLEDIADTMNRVLVAQGFPTHEYDAYRFYVGSGLKNLVTQCLPPTNRTDQIINIVYNSMVEEYELHYINKTRLYEGIPELLDALSLQNIKLAVLSNKADLITQKICHQLLNNWKFEVVMGANDRFPRKPNPASALFISEKIEVTPAHICYLGDSDVDMKTALAAGFYPVGAGWGFRPKEELIENGAQYIIDHPMNLLELFQ